MVFRRKDPQHGGIDTGLDLPAVPSHLHNVPEGIANIHALAWAVNDTDGLKLNGYVEIDQALQFVKSGDGYKKIDSITIERNSPLHLALIAWKNSQAVQNVLNDPAHRSTWRMLAGDAFSKARMGTARTRQPRTPINSSAPAPAPAAPVATVSTELFPLLRDLSPAHAKAADDLLLTWAQGARVLIRKNGTRIYSIPPMALSINATGSAYLPTITIYDDEAHAQLVNLLRNVPSDPVRTELYGELKRHGERLHRASGYAGTNHTSAEGLDVAAPKSAVTRTAQPSMVGPAPAGAPAPADSATTQPNNDTSMPAVITPINFRQTIVQPLWDILHAHHRAQHNTPFPNLDGIDAEELILWASTVRQKLLKEQPKNFPYPLPSFTFYDANDQAVILPPVRFQSSDDRLAQARIILEQLEPAASVQIDAFEVTQTARLEKRTANTRTSVLVPKTDAPAAADESAKFAHVLPIGPVPLGPDELIFDPSRPVGGHPEPDFADTKSDEIPTSNNQDAIVIQSVSAQVDALFAAADQASAQARMQIIFPADLPEHDRFGRIVNDDSVIQSAYQQDIHPPINVNDRPIFADADNTGDYMAGLVGAMRADQDEIAAHGVHPTAPANTDTATANLERILSFGSIQDLPDALRDGLVETLKAFHDTHLANDVSDTDWIHYAYVMKYTIGAKYQTDWSIGNDVTIPDYAYTPVSSSVFAYAFIPSRTLYTSGQDLRFIQAMLPLLTQLPPESSAHDRKHRLGMIQIGLTLALDQQGTDLGQRQDADQNAAPAQGQPKDALAQAKDLFTGKFPSYGNLSDADWEHYSHVMLAGLGTDPIDLKSTYKIDYYDGAHPIRALDFGRPADVQFLSKLHPLLLDTTMGLAVTKLKDRYGADYTDMPEDEWQQVAHNYKAEQTQPYAFATKKFNPRLRTFTPDQDDAFTQEMVSLTQALPPQSNDDIRHRLAGLQISPPSHPTPNSTLNQGTGTPDDGSIANDNDAQQPAPARSRNKYLSKAFAAAQGTKQFVGHVFGQGSDRDIHDARLKLAIGAIVAGRWAAGIAGNAGMGIVIKGALLATTSLTGVPLAIAAALTAGGLVTGYKILRDEEIAQERRDNGFLSAAKMAIKKHGVKLAFRAATAGVAAELMPTAVDAVSDWVKDTGIQEWWNGDHWWSFNHAAQSSAPAVQSTAPEAVLQPEPQANVPEAAAPEPVPAEAPIAQPDAPAPVEASNTTAPAHDEAAEHAKQTVAEKARAHKAWVDEQNRWSDKVSQDSASQPIHETVTPIETPKSVPINVEQPVHSSSVSTPETTTAASTPAAVDGTKSGAFSTGGDNEINVREAFLNRPASTDLGQSASALSTGGDHEVRAADMLRRYYNLAPQ